MKKGFTLVEIMIVVAIIGLLAAIAIPSFMRARTTSQMNACINNLRQIDSAKEQLGMEQGLTNGAIISNAVLVGADNFIKQWPICPNYTGDPKTGLVAMSGSYGALQTLGNNATCAVRGAAAEYTHALPAQE